MGGRGGKISKPYICGNFVLFGAFLFESACMVGYFGVFYWFQYWIMIQRIELYDIALRCIMLYGKVRCRIALFCVVLYCFVLCRILLYCMALYYIILYCVVM